MTNAREALEHALAEQREKILAMVAGPELDAEVHLHVFGRSRQNPCPLCPRGFYLNPENRCRHVPPYSTDLGAALLVLDAWEGDWKILRQNDYFEVTLYQPLMQGSDWAETLPLAICRMRLRAALTWKLP